MLRGPSALLFGSSAIGGVVNVIDTRIPRRAPEGPVGPTPSPHYGSAADERSANLGVDVPLGGHFVVHADGNCSKSDDLRTGGHLLSERPAGGSARPARFPTSARSPTSRASCPTPPPSIARAGRRPRLCRRRAQCRRFDQPPRRRYTACRSASRSTPTSRPRRRPSTSGRPAATPAPKSR